MRKSIKYYPVISLTKIDLEQIGLSKGQIRQLDDRDMTNIARIIGDCFVTDSFWEGLHYAAHKILNEKTK